MDLIVGFVSRNLVTQTNFVEFRDSRNFTIKEVRCLADPKNEILRKISKVLNKLSKVHLKEIELEPGCNKFFRARNRPE